MQPEPAGDEPHAMAPVTPTEESILSTPDKDAEQPEPAGDEAVGHAVQPEPAGDEAVENARATKARRMFLEAEDDVRTQRLQSLTDSLRRRRQRSRAPTPFLGRKGAGKGKKAKGKEKDK